MEKELTLPNNWVLKTLQQVSVGVNAIVDGPFGSNLKNSDFIDDAIKGIPVLTTKNLEGDYSNEKVRFISHSKFEEIKRSQVNPGDILVAKIGSIGKIGVYPKGYRTAIIPANLLKFTVSKDINFHYVLYYLKSQGLQNKIKAISTATAQPAFNLTKFRSLPIPVPERSQQDLIVEKIEELFSELDKGIENLKTAQQQLKVYRQAVLKSAFEGKLTNENVKDGELPEGWEYKKISDVANVGTGGTPLKSNPKFYDGGTIPWVTSGALNDIYVTKPTDYITKEALNQTNCKIYPKHTLLLAMYGEGKTRGMCSELIIEACTNQAIAAIYFDGFDNSVNPYLKYFLIKNYNDIRRKSSGGVQPNINLGIVKNLKLPLAPKVERFKVIDEIESRLSVCDKIEETITINLQQAEALRQSILKKAFEGKLVKPKVKPLYKPKSVYFYQVQLLAKIAAGSKEKGINHGEMTIAKYAYLVDKIYQIPTYYKFERWHLGPYPPEIKKAITNKKFFDKVNNSIEVKDLNTLSKYNNPYTDNLDIAIADLSDIFSLYNEKHRSHQIELMATVCKVIEDIQSTDLPLVRRSMAEWKIDLTTTHFKNKAEKFSEEETKACIDIINKKKWHLYLIKY